jgi:NAD-dependent DNA ligase
MNYSWNKNKVHFVLNEDDDQLTTKRLLTHFLKSIGVKHFDEKIVDRLINNNIKTVKQVINLTVDSLLHIEGFKITLAEKLVSQINECLDKVDAITLMVASNCWGHGFSFKKLKLVLDAYPDIVTNENITVEMINNIHGYSTITSQQFMEGLIKFRKYVKENKFNKVFDNTKHKSKKSSDLYVNKTFVFSGFRDVELEKYIIDNGGKVSTSVSKNTTAVIVKDLDAS